jgi:hypothetical protein
LTSSLFVHAIRTNIMCFWPDIDRTYVIGTNVIARIPNRPNNGTYVMSSNVAKPNINKKIVNRANVIIINAM